MNTGKAALFCATVVILSLLYFVYKIDACTSKPENCHEGFIPFGQYSSDSISCGPGATAEAISNPRPGILCHCDKISVADAGD